MTTNQPTERDKLTAANIARFCLQIDDPLRDETEKRIAQALADERAKFAALLTVVDEALEPGVFGPYRVHEDPALKNSGLLELCRDRGFGAVMSHVQWLWKTFGHHPGSEFTCAACASVRDRWIADAREAAERARAAI